MNELMHMGHWLNGTDKVLGIKPELLTLFHHRFHMNRPKIGNEISW
jgi:hypothetical protein